MKPETIKALKEKRKVAQMQLNNMKAALQYRHTVNPGLIEIQIFHEENIIELIDILLKEEEQSTTSK